MLDRGLATAYHYPAIDVLGSVSRVAPLVAPADVQQSSAVIKRLLAAHAEAKILIEVGAYVAGTNPDVDRAIRLMPHINAYLQQDVSDVPSLESSREQLMSLAGAA